MINFDFNYLWGAPSAPGFLLFFSKITQYKAYFGLIFTLLKRKARLGASDPIIPLIPRGNAQHS